MKRNVVDRLTIWDCKPSASNTLAATIHAQLVRTRRGKELKNLVVLNAPNIFPVEHEAKRDRTVKNLTFSV